jgi:cell division protein FtsB
VFDIKAKDQVLAQREEAIRSEPRARMRAWALGSAIALIALAVGSVFGDRGILNLVEKRRQVEALRSELDQLRAENARLSAEIVALRTSPRAIERLAREELSLARPDETVFLIREEDAPGRP